jgi:hypothetical protein
MIRQIIQLLAIFILPFLLYFAYVLVMRARTRAGDDKPSWEDGPWFWLAISGLALCVVAFVGVGLLRETSTDLHNVPK